MQDAADQELTVFVSYSRSDTRFTDELASGLELLGINVLIDRVAISEGEDWKARLESLIAAGDTVVFILSPASVRLQDLRLGGRYGDQPVQTKSCRCWSSRLATPLCRRRWPR